jgi:hypothetical protein
VATAIHAELRGRENVQMASFDGAVLKAHSELHPNQP